MTIKLKSCGICDAIVHRDDVEFHARWHATLNEWAERLRALRRGRAVTPEPTAAPVQAPPAEAPGPWQTNGAPQGQPVGGPQGPGWGRTPAAEPVGTAASAW